MKLMQTNYKYGDHSITACMGNNLSRSVSLFVQVFQVVPVMFYTFSTCHGEKHISKLSTFSVSQHSRIDGSPTQRLCAISTRTYYLTAITLFLSVQEVQALKVPCYFYGSLSFSDVKQLLSQI